MLAIFVIASLATMALACSGPHVQEGMFQATTYGRIGFVVETLFAIATYFIFRKVKTGPGHPIVLLVPLIVHPTWWVSAYRGDCGTTLSMFTNILLLFASVVLIWQISYLIPAQVRAKRPNS